MRNTPSKVDSGLLNAVTRQRAATGSDKERAESIGIRK